MRYTTIFAIVGLACALSMIAAEQQMPFVFQSNKKYSTSEQLIEKFAASITGENVKTIIFNIKTSSVADSIQQIGQYIKSSTELNNLFNKGYFRQLSYNASKFVAQLQKALNMKNVEETQLEDVNELEAAIKKVDNDAHIFVIFTEDKSAQQPRILQEKPVEFSPTMVMIPSETLFALILLFLLFLPILYIGISCLYGIEAPEKFATQNLVVGREY